MRAQCIVKAVPAFHDDPDFDECIENLAFKQLISDAGVEAFDKAILPRTPWSDVGGLGTNGGDPILNRLCNGLWAVV